MEFLASVLDFILLFRGVGDAVMNKKKKKAMGLTWRTWRGRRLTSKQINEEKQVKPVKQDMKKIEEYNREC